MQPALKKASDPGSSPDDKVQGPNGQPAQWSAFTKAAFRFGFVYLGLFNLETILHLFPFPPFTQLFWIFDLARGKTVHWVSKHLLHVAHDFGTDYLNPASGSKDTTYYYVQALCYLLAALIATFIWSVWGRKQREYTWLYRWFLVYLRVSVAVALISYGTAKIFPYQFAPLASSQLVDMYGHSTRNELLWVSMQVSPVYSFFGGLMEVIGGSLLMIPAFSTLGALISLGVIGNVLMLNFGYDVAVKLLVIHLALMAIVILLPEAPRLCDFFLWNRRVPQVADKPLFQRKSLNRALVILQIAFGILLISYDLYRSHQLSSQMIASRNVPLYGIWFVNDYQIKGQSRPPLSDNPHRWQRVIVNSADQVVVQVMTGASQSLYLHSDPRMKSFILTEDGMPNWIAELTYDDSKPGSLLLRGKWAAYRSSCAYTGRTNRNFP